MPLSTPGTRELVHTREIRCQGFRRSDGLWEVDGHLKDLRDFAHVSIWDQTNRPAAEPVHEMWLRLTLDATKTIVAVETSMDHIPCPPHCGEAGVNYQRLVGVTIASGFRRKVSEFVGATRGCTHVTSLLQTMATTAFQTIESDKLRAVPNSTSYARGPFMAIFTDPKAVGRHLAPQPNGCYAYSEHSPGMKELWPQYYKEP